MIELSGRLEGLIAASGADLVAVAYRDLDTGDELLVEPDAPVHPASVFKVGVLVEVYRQAEAGRFRLDDPVEVVNEFRSIADGSRYSMVATDDSETMLYEQIGRRASIRELTGLMVTRSSNLATSLLVQLVSATSVTAFMDELGASGLRVLRGPEDNVAYARGLNNVVTARALLELLARLGRREVVSAAASEEMVSLLRQQAFNEGIPAGLPAHALVAHKTGWNDRLYHDAAIVEVPDGGRYVLVVLTRGLDEATEGPALVREIARTIDLARRPGQASAGSTAGGRRNRK